MADFYLDHNIRRDTALYLRRNGHSVVTASDLSFERLPDDAHLLIAAENRWILVTHDRKDFTKLHDAWRRWSRAWKADAMHSGVLVLAQEQPAARMSDELHSFLERGLPLANELYEWRASTGWQRRE